VAEWDAYQNGNAGHSAKDEELAAFTAIVALGNLGVTIWHLRLAGELNPALSFAEAARMGALTGVLTLAGVILL
jgi:hypothetical protein